MLHLSDLIIDLGKILITAAFTTVLFRRLNQPVVLGYIIAGLLVGPQFSYFLSINDTESVKGWGEIGVIILLFSLGLEFNFKKLSTVSKSIVPAALFEVIFMLTLGYLTGQLLGWSHVDSLFLGGIISISSTTIIVSSMQELGLKAQKFAASVFGILVIEDVVAVLILVLLSTAAVTTNSSGLELFLTSTGRLLFFVILWFLTGLYLVPSILKGIRHLMTEETTLIVALAFCLLMVIIASQLGFSSALGAFFMGSLLSGTPEGKKVEASIIPIKNLFAAIFFVSVGMLIDLEILREQGLEIIVISMVLIYGKVLSVTVGTYFSGHNHKESVQVGMSLAQIGEFSFIIATLGLTLKVTSDFLFPIAVSVSAITTFLTPYLMKNARRVTFFLEDNLPYRAVKQIERYHQVLSQEIKKPVWISIYKGYAIKIFFNSIIVVGIWEIFYRDFLPLVVTDPGTYSWKASLFGVVGVFIAAPFLWAIVLGRPSLDIETDDLKNFKGLVTCITLTRMVFATVLGFYFLSIFWPLASVSGVVILLIVGFFIYYGRHIAQTIYYRIESRFLEHLR